MPHHTPPAQLTPVTSDFWPASSGGSSSSSDGPELPDLATWRPRDWYENNHLFAGLAAKLGVESRGNNWVLDFPRVYAAAVEQGESLLVIWLDQVDERMRSRCPRAQLRAKSLGVDFELVLVDCRTRGCPYCTEVMASRMSERWADAFRRGKQPVYTVVCDSIKRASAIMDYATKLKHAALRMPVGNGQHMIYTTQKRKDGVLVDVNALQDELYALLQAIEPGEGHRVTSNRPLRELAEQGDEDAEGEPAPREKGASPRPVGIDRDEGLIVSKASWYWLIRKGYVKPISRRRWQVSLPPEELAEFQRINVGGPPENRYRPAA